jgi:hypothetical protein
MGISVAYREEATLTISWTEVTGAIGDSITVLPIIVTVAVLSELSLATMLVWFGVFQVVWGLYYGVPVSVEPMKALAALVIAGTITTGELLVAGLFLSLVLLAVGATRSLTRLDRLIGSPVVRGVQFGVALVLLETGVRLGSGDLLLAGVAVAVTLALIALGYRHLSAFVVIVVGGVVVAVQTGIPSPALPAIGTEALFGWDGLTVPAAEATLAQLAMTLGNAALATSVLLADYFDREISPDELSASMGVMNLVAIPLGGFPMCHGSGGVAGKYAFGARTAGANVILGLGYVLVAVFAVGFVAAYPVAVLGVVLALIALQLGSTSLDRTDEHLFVVAVGALGLAINLGVAFVVGIGVHLLLGWRWPERFRE